MRKHLVVVRDGLRVDACNAERPGDLQRAVALRQLPETAEQALRFAACQHELAIALDP
jgi:hypothetical protein